MSGPTIRWVEVASFPREEEARLLAGRLETDGIPARVYPEGQASYYGPGTSALLGQPIRVLVPQHRTREARRAIDRLGRT